MHGQKKRRKRTIDGSLSVDGVALEWKLLSEPQWSNSGDGYIGMCIGVRVMDAARRELVIEYPYPKDKRGLPKPVPQRPEVSQPMVERSVQDAIAAGWDLQSRGKAFVFRPITD
jgi:hypothetical protein